MNGFNEQDYIRKQNDLSDWEEITKGTSSTPYEVPYDGEIAIGAYYSSWGNCSGDIYINGTLYSHCKSDIGFNKVIPVSKGDMIYVTGDFLSGDYNYFKARYYKDRDYTGR